MNLRQGNLYTFNPRNTGLYEAQLWKAYYDHRWLAALGLLFRMLRSQFSLDPLSAAQAAYWGIRAAIAWKPRENDRERVQELLTCFYTVLGAATRGHFDPSAAGAAEFSYWVIHRELDGLTEQPQLAEALAAIAAAVYSLPMTRARPAGAARARACDLVDAITAGQRPSTSKAWAEVEDLLRDAYRLLRTEITADVRPDQPKYADEPETSLSTPPIPA